MKTIRYAVILFLATTSCNNVDPNSVYQPAATANSPEQMAKKVVAALQHMSPQEYIALFPRLEEFHHMMDKNFHFYGESLSAAKEEFAFTYRNDLIPAVKESFNRIIREGKENGILWNTIQLERIGSSEMTEQRFAQDNVTIDFIANGKKHTVILEKALLMNAEWKVSQYIKLD